MERKNFHNDARAAAASGQFLRLYDPRRGQQFVRDRLQSQAINHLEAISCQHNDKALRTSGPDCKSQSINVISSAIQLGHVVAEEHPEPVRLVGSESCFDPACFHDPGIGFSRAKFSPVCRMLKSILTDLLLSRLDSNLLPFAHRLSKTAAQTIAEFALTDSMLAPPLYLSMCADWNRPRHRFHQRSTQRASKW